MARSSDAGPGYDLVPVTPSDSTVFAPCRGFYVSVAGSLVFKAHSGETRTVTVVAGWFPFGGTMVTTATTATGIHAGY